MSENVIKYSPINLKTHAIIDLLGLLTILVSPWLFQYSEFTGATQYAIFLFFLGMGLNIVTDYPLGVVKKLPMKWHKMVEMTSPGIFIIAPWVFFSGAGLMPYVVSLVGVIILINCILTRPT
jgi:hypothetical protein